MSPLDQTAVVEKAMTQSPTFVGVPRAHVKDFAAQGRVRAYRRGTYLCQQGDEADRVYFLVKGRVEISSISLTGNRILHATVDQPQFLGELPVLGEMDRTADLLALEDSEVWSIAAGRFLDFVTSEPSAARQVLAALARQVREHESFVDDLLFLDLKGRVAKRLLQMGTSTLSELPEDGSSIPAVTHADLASLCGGSRENVSRILSDLQRRGVVSREGSRYVLAKVSYLARLAAL
ncbi:MAG: Crp/Fnr family transcriptional regulator [Actinomycetota bacterium]